MRAHESNMRSLFAGREESAMRQTEGLRVHIESTVEQSEERMSALVENGVAGSGGTFEAGSVAEVRLRELGNKMARLMEMVTGLQGGQEVVGDWHRLHRYSSCTFW